MVYIILIICLLSSGFTANFYKKLSDDSDSKAASVMMPSVWFLILGVMFVIITAVNGISGNTVIPAAIGAGLCYAAACSILIESMKTNSFSIATIIVNLNFIIPVILSAIFLKELASPLQLFGMVASIVVILLLNLNGNSEKSKPGAVLLPLAACLANGLLNYFIKVNGNAGGDGNLFFVIAYFTAAVVCALTSLILHKKSDGKMIPDIKIRRTLPFILMVGVCNGVCYYTIGLLIGMMNATAQFTIVTAGSILLSLAVGFLFQGDKFTPKTAISILFCLVAVFCQAGGIA